MTKLRNAFPRVTPATPAWATFREALNDLADNAQHTPCGDPRQAHLWTSEDPQARALAAVACGPCPLLNLCHAAAESTREPAGTWAGRDRQTPTPERTTA